MSAITLHYFDAYGRAEATRMMFHHHNVAFTDDRIAFADWPAFLATGQCEFDSLPLLEMDGLKMNQSRSINRYVSAKYGYEGANPYDDYLIESLCDTREDTLKFMNGLLFKKDQEGFENALRTDFVGWLKIVESRLEMNNKGAGWLVGNKITRADFEMFQTINDYVLRPSFNGRFESILTINAPKVKAWMERFRNSSPTLKAYLDRRAPSWI